MKYYFSNIPGEKIGPVSAEDLLRLVESGTVSETTQVKTFCRSRPAKKLPFLEETFRKERSESSLTWQGTPSLLRAGGNQTLPVLYTGDRYFAAFWKRSRRFRRSLKFLFWLLLLLFGLAALGFGFVFSVLWTKSNLLTVFGTTAYAVVAFFVLFPIAFSLVLCRRGIVGSYADEAQVRAAEDIRKMRILEEERFRSQTAG